MKTIKELNQEDIKAVLKKHFGGFECTIEQHNVRQAYDGTPGDPCTPYVTAEVVVDDKGHPPERLGRTVEITLDSYRKIRHVLFNVAEYSGMKIPQNELKKAAIEVLERMPPV